MTYLVDLNYTLAVSEHGDGRPMAERIAAERYRGWLVELLAAAQARGDRAVLVTARPVKWARATLERLEAVTGWAPDAAYFNELGLPPPQLKPRLLVAKIMPRFGADPATYFGIESNPATRAAYAAVGVASLPVPAYDPVWTVLPPW